MTEQLPPGFTLDPQPDASSAQLVAPNAQLPPGFTLDQPEPSFLETAGRTIADTAQTVSDFVTGRGKSDDPSLPEFGNEDAGSLAANLKIGGGLLITPDLRAQADIIKSAVPDAEIKEDSKGNILVRFPQQSEFAFLNKPGLSFQDVIQGIAQVLSFLPGVGVAARATQGAGRLTQIGAQGVAAAATSVGQDLAVQPLGSKQSPDPVRAVISGVFGAGGEVISPLIGRVFAALPFRRGLVNSDGSLNAKGLEFARSSGIDPNDISPSMAKALDEVSQRFSRAEITQALKGFTDDAKAAVQGATEQTRFNVPLTVGQRTGNLTQQAQEEALRSGARGDPGQKIIERFDSTQAQRLVGAVESDVQSVGRPGGPKTQNAVEASGTLATRIKDTATDLQTRISEAYKQAGGLDARLDISSLKQADKFIRETLAFENVPVDSKIVTPKTRLALKSLKGIIDGPKGVSVTQVNLKRIEGFRQSLNQLLKGEKSGTDQTGLLVVKRALDQYLDFAFDNALFSGDAKALASIKGARSLRTEFGRKFEKNNAKGFTDDAGEIIEKIVSADRTNVEVANWLFGNAKLGHSARSVRLIDKVEQIFGEGSEELVLLQEGAVRRLLFQNHGAGNELVGIQRMQSALKDYLLGDGKPFAKRLHPPGQIQALSEFMGLINKIAPKQDAIQRRRLGINASGSGAFNSRSVIAAFQKLATAIGFAGDPLSGAAIHLGGKAVSAASSAGQAKAATRLSLPAPRMGVLFGAGVNATGNELGLEQ